MLSCAGNVVCASLQCAATPGGPPRQCDPKVLRPATEVSPGIITALIERDPELSTDIFRQTYRRTLDPAERRAALLEKLAGTFFQRPARFSDTLTALFLLGSELAERLFSNRDCVLDFAHSATRRSVTCRVDDLDRPHPFGITTPCSIRTCQPMPACGPSIRIGRDLIRARASSCLLASAKEQVTCNHRRHPTGKCGIGLESGATGRRCKIIDLQIGQHVRGEPAAIRDVMAPREHR
jgi:hypothetical protein